MLRQIYRENEKVVINNDLVEISDRACWVDLIAPSAKELELVSRRFAIDFRPRTGGSLKSRPTSTCEFHRSRRRRDKNRSSAS